MPAHGTILINFGSEKRSYIFSFSLTSRGLSPSGRCSGPAGDLSGPQTTRQEVRPLAESTGSTPIIYEVPMLCMLLSSIMGTYHFYNSVHFIKIIERLCLTIVVIHNSSGVSGEINSASCIAYPAKLL